MAQTELTISLKVRWWVKPVIAVLTLAARLRIPFNEARAVKFVSRGIVPVVGVLPRSPLNIPMPQVRPTLGKRPLFDRSTYCAPDTDAA